MEQETILNIDPNQEKIFDLVLEQDSFYEEKEKISFIKNVERLIRSSLEYKRWVKYIKEVIGDDYCFFTGEVNNEVTIEIHHHPFTLFDLVTIMIDTQIYNEKKFTSLQIAQSVLKLHYENLVGYIPIVKTLHEKYHNGFLDIPIDLVHGNWKYLITSNNYIINENIMNKVNSLISITTKTNDISKYKKWYEV